MLSIQDAVVVDDAVAELILTLPFAEWYPGHPGLINNLDVFPNSEHTLPPTTSDVPPVALDV